MQAVTTTCKSARVPFWYARMYIHACVRPVIRDTRASAHAQTIDLFLSRASCNHLMPYLGPRTATRPFSVSLILFPYPFYLSPSLSRSPLYDTPITIAAGPSFLLSFAFPLLRAFLPFVNSVISLFSLCFPPRRRGRSCTVDPLVP